MKKGYDIVTGHDHTALLHTQGTGLVEEWQFDNNSVFKAGECILNETSK